MVSLSITRAADSGPQRLRLPSRKAPCSASGGATSSRFSVHSCRVDRDLHGAGDVFLRRIGQLLPKQVLIENGVRDFVSDEPAIEFARERGVGRRAGYRSRSGAWDRYPPVRAPAKCCRECSGAPSVVRPRLLPALYSPIELLGLEC